MYTLRQLLERCTGSNGFGLWAVEIGKNGHLFTEYHEMEGGVAQFNVTNEYGDVISYEIPLDEKQSENGQFSFNDVTIYKLVEVK